jgi:hypothetical protein
VAPALQRREQHEQIGRAIALVLIALNWSRPSSLSVTPLRC